MAPRISPVGAYLCGAVFGLPAIMVALRLFNWIVPAIAAGMKAVL